MNLKKLEKKSLITIFNTKKNKKILKSFYINFTIYKWNKRHTVQVDKNIFFSSKIKEIIFRQPSSHRSYSLMAKLTWNSCPIRIGQTSQVNMPISLLWFNQKANYR